jgi:transcriptional regulator with GAF, ATPase, and Fis domain
MNDHDALEQLAPDPVAQADDGAPGTASDALLLWKELRDYRHRRDAWECDLYRLVQSHRDLEARHWQLVLHAIEATAAREERDARSGLLPALGEAGPSYDERMGLFKRSLLDTALARAGGCRRKAADLLGLLPSTLCEKLKRLGDRRRPH